MICGFYITLENLINVEISLNGIVLYQIKIIFKET